jgi:hypothetical protein
MSEHKQREAAAQAAGTPTAVKPVDTKKILDALPGLIGGIDGAIRDIAQTKTPVGFVLIIVANGQAMYCTNGDPEMAKNCIKELAKVIDTAETKPAFDTAPAAEGEAAPETPAE